MIEKEKKPRKPRHKCWIKCENCSAQTKRIRNYKGTFLCYKCWIKKVKIIKSGHYTTLTEATEKVYKVRGTMSPSSKYVACSCSFPVSLMGRKFKITLLPEEEEEEKKE